MDFDYRASAFLIEPTAEWSAEAIKSHLDRREALKSSIAVEFGQHSIEEKVRNFIDVGTKPMSVISYHSELFEHCRQSFISGHYYPALVGACALAERILNHLVLDLREYYTSSSQFKKIYRKESFDDWRTPIHVLEEWGVLLPSAAEGFRELMPIRNRSIHFNPAIYTEMRGEALKALSHLKHVIEQQFGSFAIKPWFIEGTKGHVFIRKKYEEDPFVKTYFLPQCPFVGPLFAMRVGNGGWEVFDLNDYGSAICSDDYFAAAYNSRKFEDVVVPPDH